MTVSEQLKVLAVRLHISLAEMARRCDMSPQNFNQRMQRGTFSADDLRGIAEKLGVKYEGYFVLEGGEKV